MANETNGGMIHCSFCGKPEYQVERLLYGHSAYICDECVDLCYHMLVDDGVFMEPSGASHGRSRKTKDKIRSFPDIGAPVPERSLSAAAATPYSHASIWDTGSRSWLSAPHCTPVYWESFPDTSTYPYDYLQWRCAGKTHRPAVLPPTP